MTNGLVLPSAFDFALRIPPHLTIGSSIWRSSTSGSSGLPSSHLRNLTIRMSAHVRLKPNCGAVAEIRPRDGAEGFADLGRARFSGRRRARCWTASRRVLDGVKEGAGRRQGRCWTPSSQVPDGVEESAGRRLAKCPTPSSKKRSPRREETALGVRTAALSVSSFVQMSLSLQGVIHLLSAGIYGKNSLAGLQTTISG